MTNLQQIIEDTDLIMKNLLDFYEPDEVRKWFMTPQKLLNGEVPSSLVVQGRTAEVLRLIDQLHTGAYI